MIFKQKEKPEINSKYIYAVTNKHFAGLRDVLENLDSDFSDYLMQEIKDNAKLELDKIEDEAKQLKETEKILNNNSSEEKVQIKMSWQISPLSMMNTLRHK